MKMPIEGKSKKLSFVGCGFSVVALFLSVILVVSGVVARYVFRVGVIFIDEYIGYLLVVITFMGMAHTLCEDGHIKVDLILRRLPRKVHLWFQLVTSLISFAISILLTFQTYQRVLIAYKFKAVSVTPIETPLFIPQMFIPIGFALLSIAVLSYIVKLMVDLLEFSDGH